MAEFPRDRDGGLPMRTPLGHVSFPSSEKQVLKLLEDTLKNQFGKDHFLPKQREIMTEIYRGRSGMVVLPTAGGKTWSFVVPSYARYLQDGELTIVVSPLRALIRDQANKYRSQGLPTAYITGDMSQKDRKEQLEHLQSGRTAFLITTPERLFVDSFWDTLAALPAMTSNGQRVGRIVFDEAHCIARWGRTFRSGYSAALQNRLSFDAGPLQTIACTATATPEDVRFIREVLGLDESSFFVKGSLDRTNLSYRVRFMQDRLDAAEYLTLKLTQRYPGPTLIYCRTRNQTEEIAQELSNNGLKAAAYHAGMNDDDRLAVEQGFLSDDLQVIAATCAYGMGIDKPNIRYIAHIGIPDSLASYSQETGRAGRDGKYSTCELLYSNQDAFFMHRLLSLSHPTQTEMVRQYFRYLDMWDNSRNARSNGDRTILIPPPKNQTEDEHDRFWRNKNSAIDCQLARYGLIDDQGYHKRLLVDRQDVLGYLPGDREIAQDWDRTLTDLALMTYVAEEQRPFTRNRLGVQQAFQLHFEHNSLINKLPQNRELHLLTQLDMKQLTRVLLAVHKQDYSLSDLVRALKNGGAQIGGENKNAASLSRLTLGEIEGLIVHAADRGYLRLHEKKGGSFVSLAENGAGLLTDIIPEEEKHTLEPSKTFAGLHKRIGHYAERPLLQELIEPWFQKVALPCKTLQEFDGSLKKFRIQKFNLLGQDVDGGDLVARFHGTRRDRVRLEDCRRFLSYLFPDVLAELAQRYGRLDQ